MTATKAPADAHVFNSSVELLGQKLKVELLARPAFKDDAALWKGYKTKSTAFVFVDEAVNKLLGFNTDLPNTSRGEDPFVDKMWDNFNARLLIVQREIMTRTLSKFLSTEHHASAERECWIDKLTAHSPDTMKFDRHAGCRCQCSPGWVLTHEFTQVMMLPHPDEKHYSGPVPHNYFLTVTLG